MFLLNITYTKPIEEIDRALAAHRAWLGDLVDKKIVLFSGPKNPRLGGLIMLRVKTRGEAEALAAADPFAIAGVASYEVIEFTPVKCDPAFMAFVDA